MSGQVIHDKTLGDITVRRNARAKYVRIRVAPAGKLYVSAPRRTPLFMIKRIVVSSRADLEAMLKQQRPDTPMHDGADIGKSHTLIVRRGAVLNVQRQDLRIIVTLPADKTLTDPEVQEHLRVHIVAALRREAKGYLPRRLSFLAEKHRFHYQRVRLSHASSRWGSCSSSGTISLNIALMKLPFELIDYVIIHELAHTQHMNHSKTFWALVGKYDPEYMVHRTQLKQESPVI